MLLLAKETPIYLGSAVTMQGVVRVIIRLPR
jgi:hypothetical protein